MTPSYRLKLARAQEHLDQLTALLGPVSGRRPRAVRETFKTKEDQGRFAYRLEVGFEVPEDALVLAGDFLFDARSALDHLAIALARRELRKAATFPILVDDPFTLREDEEEFVETRAQRAWRKATRALPERVVEVLEGLQPFAVARETGERPEDQPLAQLDALRRAERRQELRITATGISQTALTVEGETVYLAPLIPHGTVLHLSPTKVNVQVVGASHIAIGIVDGDLFPFPAVFDAIVGTITHDVLPSLEPLLPNGHRS
jgi:hypothetical protein